jgi:uncharacterized integral membrane protein
MTTPESSSSSRPSGGATKRKGTLTPKRLVLLVLLALVVVFGLVNSQSVTVHWVFATVDTPLIVVIAVTLIIGLAVGYGAAKYQARGASGS